MSLEGPRFRDETAEVGERPSDLEQDELLLNDEPGGQEAAESEAASEAVDRLSELVRTYLDNPSEELKTQIRQAYEDAVQEFGEYPVYILAGGAESDVEMGEEARTLWDIVGKPQQYQ